MTEKRFQIIDDDLFDNENMEVLMVDFEVDGVPRIVDLLNEQHEQIERLKRNFKALDELKCEIAEENEELKKENQRMTNKLNQIALEFLNYNIITMGKATEISEMCYHDFLKYRKENGNPMELQL